MCMFYDIFKEWIYLFVITYTLLSILISGSECGVFEIYLYGFFI